MAPAGEDRRAGNSQEKPERYNEPTELLEFHACPISAVSRSARQRLCTPAQPVGEDISEAISDCVDCATTGTPIPLQMRNEMGPWGRFENSRATGNSDGGSLGQVSETRFAHTTLAMKPLDWSGGGDPKAFRF